MSVNLRGLSARRGLEGGLYDETVRAASVSEEEGPAMMSAVGSEFMTGPSAVLGAGSFYDFLKPGHSSMKAFVCNGTACLTSGSGDRVRSILLEKHSHEEIGSVTCLGHCHSGNVCMTGDGVRDADGGEIARGPALMSNTGTPVLFSEAPGDWSYYSVAGRALADPLPVMRELEISGLRGRGGAGFPFHLKVASATRADADQKYVVCNADEGDPGAFSDKWLLEERPHAVLFGMLVTGIITGADSGVIYIRGEYPVAVKTVRRAISDLESAGITTNGSSSEAAFPFRFHVTVGSGAYICGEETSLLNSLEGLRPEVRTRPPFPASYGLFGKPTVVSNVETFASVHSILMLGGAAWASLGTEKSPGTKLVSLDSGFNRPGLLEVRMGTPLSQVIYEMGGGFRYPVKAIQVGGPLGGIVPVTQIDSLTLDFESFSSSGFLLGHAGVVSVPGSFPMIKFLVHLFEFAARESCGKCFPCRIGTARGYEMLSTALDGGTKADSTLFSDLLDTMQSSSLCALGGGLPLPARNALKWFSHELEDYLRP